MLISPAYAQAATGAAPGFSIMSLLPILLIFGVFYFLLIRPQQKKLKQHKDMVAGLRRGDRVVTAGGIIGTVAKVEDDTMISVEIAPNVRVKVSRPTIAEVLAKTEPAPASNDDDDDSEESEDDSTTSTRGGGRRKPK
tara:strand:+ start:179 stop:592 length:414 start_codon:yes stop_codon:yes gene_type:complete